jgi:thioredoxin reductase
VIVIDAGSPRNAPATGVHSFLSRDGISPAELIETGQKEVDRYGGLVFRGEARAARRTADGFEVTLDDGRLVTARRLLVTTGLVDELPDLPGVRERWGRDVLHCPYCHGWEIRDQPVGILGSGERAVHQALLFRQWTSDLVLFTHTAPALTDEQAEQLADRGIGRLVLVRAGLGHGAQSRHRASPWRLPFTNGSWQLAARLDRL